MLKTKRPGAASKHPEHGLPGSAGGGCSLDQLVHIAQIPKEFALSDTLRTGEDVALEGLAEGSLPAFERLFQGHAERMKSIAANLLGSVADAEDAVQEAFLKVYRSAPGFRGGAAVTTWIYRILVNTCYDQIRRRSRRPEAPLPAKLAFASPGESDHPLRLAIQTEVSRLPASERAAFLLCEVEGFSHREAAEILEIPEATSRTLLFRARRRLQKALRGAGAFAAPEAPV